MKLIHFIFFFLICVSTNAQSFCSPTDVPVDIYGANTISTSTTNIGPQYLCGPNTILYDTLGPQDCRKVYVENNSTLFLRANCSITDFIWLRSTSTLNIMSDSHGIIEIFSGTWRYN